MAANALGNPSDIPLRSLEALRTADLIVFEEDKVARQTLKAASIHRDYLRLTEHLELDTIDAVKKALKSGQTVVFMSAQGTPTLADPGKKLLDVAYAAGAHVSPIPGPSSVTAALSICHFSMDPSSIWASRHVNPRNAMPGLLTIVRWNSLWSSLIHLTAVRL